MKYTVIVEEGPSSYGAYVPDLPGCVAVADTRAEVSTLIQEAIAWNCWPRKVSLSQSPGHRRNSSKCKTGRTAA